MTPAVDVDVGTERMWTWGIVATWDVIEGAHAHSLPPHHVLRHKNGTALTLVDLTELQSWPPHDGRPTYYAISNNTVHIYPRADKRYDVDVFRDAFPPGWRSAYDTAREEARRERARG